MSYHLQILRDADKLGPATPHGVIRRQLNRLAHAETHARVEVERLAITRTVARLKNVLDPVLCLPLGGRLHYQVADRRYLYWPAPEPGDDLYDPLVDREGPPPPEWRCGL